MAAAVLLFDMIRSCTLPYMSNVYVFRQWQDTVHMRDNELL